MKYFLYVIVAIIMGYSINSIAKTKIDDTSVYIGGKVIDKKEYGESLVFFEVVDFIEQAYFIEQDPEEYEKRIYLIKALSDSGAFYWQVKHAYHLLDGKGVEKDPERAVQLLEKAVVKNVVGVKSNLAKFYETGQHGVKQNIDRALYLYSLAEDYEPIARIYAEGKYVDRSIVESLEYYLLTENAALHPVMSSVDVSTFHLSPFFEEIKIKIKDGKKLTDLEEYYYAAYHYWGLLGAERDSSYMKKFLSQKNIPENKYAYRIFGRYYCLAPQNESFREKGLELLRKTAESGNSRFMFEYGHVLASGSCSNKKDIKAAEKWLVASAELGNRDAIKYIIELSLKEKNLPKKLLMIADTNQYEDMEVNSLNNLGLDYSLFAKDLENGKYKDDPFVKYILGLIHKYDVINKASNKKAGELLFESFMNGYSPAAAEFGGTDKMCSSKLDLGNDRSVDIEVYAINYLVNKESCSILINNLKEKLQKKSVIERIKIWNVLTIGVYESSYLRLLGIGEVGSRRSLRNDRAELIVATLGNVGVIPGVRAGEKIRIMDHEIIDLSKTDIKKLNQEIIERFLKIFRR